MQLFTVNMISAADFSINSMLFVATYDDKFIATTNGHTLEVSDLAPKRPENHNYSIALQISGR